MSYLPNDPNFTHSFYNIYNPKLWDEVSESQHIKEKLRQKLSQGYEVRENGIASFGDYRDEAETLGRKELHIQNGSNIKYYKSADELVERLEILAGSMNAGNKSLELRNEAFDIIDRLFDDRELTKAEYIKLYKSFI